MEHGMLLIDSGNNFFFIRSTDTVLTTTGLLGAVAWFLSLFGAVYCKFLTNTLTTEFGQGRKINLNYGLWTYQGFGIASTSDETVIFETCRPYPSETYLDAKWNCAIAFSTMSIIIGGVTTLWTLFALCGNTPSTNTFRTVGFTLMLCCIVSILNCFYLDLISRELTDLSSSQFQGLTLLFLTSAACTNNAFTSDLLENMSLFQVEDTCAMSVSAKCTIAATVFWFVAAAPTFMTDIALLDKVDTQQNACKAEDKVIDPDSKLFDKDVTDEEIGDEHTLETTEAA